MKARVKRRWLGRSTRASIWCTNQTENDRRLGRDGSVPVSVPLPVVRQYAAPRSVALLAGLSCTRSGGAVGAQLINSGCIRGGSCCLLVLAFELVLAFAPVHVGADGA